MTENNLILLHLGSFIEIQRLELDLNDAEIPFVVKNRNESARLAGFGVLGDHIEIYVFKSDFEFAAKILRDLKSGIN